MSKKNFKKFVEKLIPKIQAKVKKENTNASVFLLKEGINAVSFINGDPLSIHILLEEAAIKDPMFAIVLKQVAKRIKKHEKGELLGLPGDEKITLNKVERKGFPSINVDGSDVKIGDIGLTMEQIDNMTDEELEKHLDKFSNDINNKFKERDDEQDSSEE